MVVFVSLLRWLLQVQPVRYLPHMLRKYISLLLRRVQLLIVVRHIILLLLRHDIISGGIV